MAKVKRWWAGAGRGILQTHEAKIRIAMQIHSHTHTPIHTGRTKKSPDSDKYTQNILLLLTQKISFWILIFVLAFQIWDLVNAYKHTLTLTLQVWGAVGRRVPLIHWGGDSAQQLTHRHSHKNNNNSACCCVLCLFGAVLCYMNYLIYLLIIIYCFCILFESRFTRQNHHQRRRRTGLRGCGQHVAYRNRNRSPNNSHSHTQAKY